MFLALFRLHSKFNEEQLLTPFNGLITPKMLDELQHLLPTANPYACKVSDFANGTFPFEAYSEKSTTKAMMQTKKEGPNG